MRKFPLYFIIACTCMLLLESRLVQSEEIDHPYLHTENFKKAIAEIDSKHTELNKVLEEEKNIDDERRDLSRIDFSILEFTMHLPFTKYVMQILFASIILACIYIIYLKKYNQAKWFICFKSTNNISRLLRNIKKANTLILLLISGLSLVPTVSHAATDVLTDAKLFFFGNEVERGYVLVKYPVTGRGLTYDQIKGIHVYPTFESNSFEQHYNYLVHELGIGISPRVLDLLRLIEKVKSVQALDTVYDFIFKIDDSAILREVIQNRLQSLSRIKLEMRLLEMGIVCRKAQETGHLALVKDDLAAALNTMIPEISGTPGTLQIANLFAYVNPEKSYELLDKIKFKFQEIIWDEGNASRFKAAYLALAKVKPGLYKQGDNFGLDDQNDPSFMVAVASFFDSFDEKIASAIIKDFHLDRTTKVKPEIYAQLATLWQKYRSTEVASFFDVFTSGYIKSSRGTLNMYLNIADRLGFSKEAAIDCLIKHDSEYLTRPEGSTLVTQEFLDLFSAEYFDKHFGYFKTRTNQASIILNSLITKRFDLFVDYLKFCNDKVPQVVSNLSFENKLADFTKWKGLVDSKSIKEFRVPAVYYLASSELSAAQPDFRKIAALLQARADSVLEGIIRTDSNLSGPEFLDALLLYHQYTRIIDPGGAEMNKVLETGIGSQVKKIMERQISSTDSDLHKAKGRLQGERVTLNEIKNRRTAALIEVTVILILATIIGLYILAALLFSIKYAINAVSGYSGSRIGLFAAVFSETFAKFLTPILYFTGAALGVIILVQLYGFLRDRDGAVFPNVQQSLASYRADRERIRDATAKG